MFIKNQTHVEEIKWYFLKRHIPYLGHLISEVGIEPFPEKLSSLQNMPPPRNPKEFEQFLGLASYYWKFVPWFTDISWPLTALTKKNVPYECTQICQDLFDLFKKYLMESSNHKYPDPEKSYTLFTDASKYAMACVFNTGL